MIVRNLRGVPTVRFEAPERNAVTELRLACNFVLNNLDAGHPINRICSELMPRLESLERELAKDDKERAKTNDKATRDKQKVAE